MNYKSVETYQFSIPDEQAALLRFKNELKSSGIPFTESGGAFYQTITITTNGRFDMREKEGAKLS